MTELVHEGRQVPFTSYRAVKGQEVEQLLERMRITVPSSIRESEKTVAERDRILAEAKIAADKIVEDAHRRALEILNERGLLERARQESQRIVARGQADAQYRIDEADRYTIGSLRELRNELRALIHQVDSGLAMMEGQVHGSSSQISQPDTHAVEEKVDVATGGHEDETKPHTDQEPI